jgi:DNA-binding IclR family transcriptional regulator
VVAEGQMAQRRDGERKGGSVQSVARALTLLDALGESRSEIGVAELSKQIGFHVSTAHRLLATLIAQGYARQNPETGRYGLGAKAFHLAESYLSQMDLRRVVRPILERLSHETGETANLVLLDGREAFYLDKVESPQSLRIFSRIGRRAPLHCTAAGKVLLAGRAWPDVRRMLGRTALERFTPRTILSAEVLRRELEAARTDGYAMDHEECEEGATCIAVPVRNARGETVAAMSISGPTLRMQPERLQGLTPVIVRMGVEASERFGYGARMTNVSRSPLHTADRKAR